MVEILLVGGKKSIINNADYKLVSKYRWYELKKKHTSYAITFIKKENHKFKTISMHRLIMDAKITNIYIDHRNLNGLDNRRKNLRSCTPSQNSANSNRPRGKSKFRGVAFSSACNKWQAYIGINGKKKHLGVFVHEIDAAIAYNNAAFAQNGEFALLNKI